MTRLEALGRAVGNLFLCCIAAVIAMGVAIPGSGISGRFSHVREFSTDRTPHVNAAAACIGRTGPVERYEQFPLAFEPNRAQTNAEARYLARGNGYILFLTENEAVFTMGKTSRPSVLRMKLLNSNSKASFAAMEELPGKSNYLIGNRPEKWHTNIPNYRKVAEHNVYAGIDLAYYGTQRQLEYDFVVNPGAKLSSVHIAFQGAENLHTDANGDLVLSIAGNNMRFHKPVAYQLSGVDKQFVAANYVLAGKDRIEFGVGAYDASRTLIVDPILSYSTYVGGTNIDTANAIAVATDGTAFIAGGTFSSDFPTAHPLQPNVGGPFDFPRDAFVAKISADGSTLLYSTYLGGEFQDIANGIAVDTFGNAYITGTTMSPDFPVTPGVINTECGGDAKCGATYNKAGLLVSNAFVTKLNIAGSAAVYSLFLGEFENVHGNAIAVDGNGNAFVTGQTEPNRTPDVPVTVPPPPFPISGTAFEPTFGFTGAGATNAFLTEISATGTTFRYSSYLGGTGEDSGTGIAVDGNGNAYITGLAYSSDYRTFRGLQSTNSGAGDAFLARVNTNASGPASLVYNTLLGGNALDEGTSVAVDSAGNAYVGGVTHSVVGTLGFTPVGSFQSNCALNSSGVCEGDAFVAKLNTNLAGAASLVYFTYLGGSHADAATGIAVDASGVYVTGATVSTDFPTTSSAFQHGYGGGNADGFVTKLDPSGATLAYSSYLGGSNTDVPAGIAVDTSNSAYITGQTCSQDFPLANPLQSNPGGNCDAFVSKVSILAGIALNPAGLTFPTLGLGATSLPQTVTLTNGDNPLTISSITVTGANSGDYSASNTCGTSLPAGGQCTISATFAPTSPGIRKASISVVDSAPGSPQVLNLTGSTSSVILSTSSLAFGTQAVGAPSTPQTVTVTNAGSSVLTISGITASNDFKETDSCSVPLQPGTNCLIKVTFTPTASGSSIGALAITDNAPGPQIVQPTGTGQLQPPDFKITPVVSSATISAGQNAPFALMISPIAGFSQPVAITCDGLPRQTTCAASPNPVTLDGTTPTNVQLIISTAVRTMSPPISQYKMGPGLSDRLKNLNGWLAWPVLLLVLATLVSSRLRPAMSGFGLAAIVLLVLVGCSGGSSTGVPAGTPAGTTQVAVTARAGSMTHTTMLTLKVN
jgi:hypothetical protein